MKALSFLQEGFQKGRGEYYEWTLYNASISYLCVGEPELAGKFTDAALSLAPDNIMFMNQKWFIQMVRGNYDEMQQTINRYESMFKTNEGLYSLGWAYLLMGEFEKSEKAYAQFFSLSKDVTKFYAKHKINYAYVLRKLAKEKEALVTIQEARDFAEKEDPFYDMARVHLFLGEREKALQVLSMWKPTNGLQDWMEKDPLFESIKDDPEFKRLVKQFKAEVDVLRKQSKAKRAKGEFPTLEMIEKGKL